MSKPAKKRNKPYRGTDASTSTPVIHRIEAIDRGRLGQWWFEKKRLVKPVAITSGIVAFVGWLIFELVRIAAG